MANQSSKWMIAAAMMGISSTAQAMLPTPQLQKSVEDWFFRNGLPHIQRSLEQLTSYGAKVEVPRVILPPHLGGPIPKKGMVKVQVEGWATGVASYDLRNSGRWDSWRSSEFVECRIRQELDALVDEKGRPIRIAPAQTFRGVVTCASGDLRFPNHRPY